MKPFADICGRSEEKPSTPALAHLNALFEICCLGFLWSLVFGAFFPLCDIIFRMDRVLLQVKKKKDRRRLEDWLSKSCRILLPDSEHPLKEEVDLVIIDGPSLKQLRSKVRAMRK